MSMVAKVTPDSESTMLAASEVSSARRPLQPNHIDPSVVASARATARPPAVAPCSLGEGTRLETMTTRSAPAAPQDRHPAAGVLAGALGRSPSRKSDGTIFTRAIGT